MEYKTADFNGIWDTDFGIMELIQTGADVEGFFSDNGIVTGTVKGNRLWFDWKDLINGEGRGIFIVNHRNNKIRGCRETKGDNHPKKNWNAVRYMEPVYEGTPTYWYLNQTWTYLDKAGNRVHWGNITGTAILYFTGNKVSGKYQGTLNYTMLDRVVQEDVFNHLSGVKVDDTLNLSWHNPTHGFRGTMLLKNDIGQWKGPWRIDNDDSKGDTVLTPSSSPDKMGSSEFRYHDTITKLKNLFLGNQALQNGEEQFGHSQYPEAETEYFKALHYFEFAHRPEKMADIYKRLGDMYDQTGSYEVALDNYQKALALNTKENIDDLVVKAGIMRVRFALGQDCDDIDFTAASEKDMDQFLTNPAHWLYAVKYKLKEADPVAARQIYDQFMKEEPRAASFEFESNDLENLEEIETLMAQKYFTENEFDNSIYHYKRKKTILEKINTKQIHNRGLGETRIAGVDESLALAYARKGDFQTAAVYFQNAIELKNKNQDPGIWRAYYDYAKACSKQPGITQETVIGYYEKSIQALETLNQQLTRDENIKSFMEYNTYLYQSYIQYLNGLNQPDYHRRALEIAELARSRAFMELIAQRFYGPEFSGQHQQITSADFQQIQETSARVNAAIIVYYILDYPFRGAQKQLVVWLVNPDGQLYTQTVSLAGIDFDSLIHTSNQEILASGTPKAPKADGKTAGGRLYQILFPAEIEAHLPQAGDARLILVPHKGLGVIPLMALQSAEGKYLIDKYCCQQVPGIGVLLRTHEIKTKRLADQPNVKLTPDSFLLFGNPLPDTKPLWDSEEEVQAIADIFQAEAFIGQAASEYWFKKVAANKTIIHLATHGEANPEAPLESKILLAPGFGEDGLVTAAEILAMKLNADLVVLSACQTGLGKVSGDGIEGLARSLMIAGAVSVVVSLWNVKDEPTKELMTAFYQNLASGMKKAEALRQAQLFVKSHPQWEQPINWAAFLLYGEGD